MTLGRAPGDGPGDGLLALPARGIGEVSRGDDLVALLAQAWSHAGTEPQDGDVVVVTSKVVSKSEGRIVSPVAGPVDKDAVVAAETDREVARRGATRVVRTRHGYVMAAAGVDASNVEPGSLVLLPEDPDASARRLRDGFQERGACVGVVVSDTSGRAWRTGQTDIALGAAGIVVLDDHQGRVDRYGNALAVTAPAVADELAATAELATGKLGHSPACLVRGLGRFVLPAGRHGSGARALVRPEESDMFGLGAREAVLAVLTALSTRPDPADAVPPRGFGAAAPAAEVIDALRSVVPRSAAQEIEGRLVVPMPTDAEQATRDRTRVVMLLLAHGWRAEPGRDRALVAVPGL